MKPQLVVTDLTGIHNQDVVKTRHRVIRGNSWKRHRIVLIIPADVMIPAKVALSHWNIMFPPNQNVVKILAQGMEVGEAYTQALEQIMGHPELSTWEHLLTIEHDNMPPPDGVLRLIERMDELPHYSCLSGLYYTKGEQGVPQIWGDIKDPVLNFRPVPPVPDGVVECHGVGMGFALWDLKMFKDPKLRRPWFKTLSGNGGLATQDLYAWQDFKKHGYRCAVDCSVKVGHYDVNSDIVW